MIPYFAELPPELYDAILAQVPREERQQATLSLTRAIPRSQIPLHHLFEWVRLKSAEKAVQLHRRLRGGRDEQRWVKEFSLEAWSVDADVVVNLVALLPQLTTISLFIGPNFAPEHMEEILGNPRETLSYISLRFRPYVQKATYYQFLKGTYFDTALLALSRWPTAGLPTLSIIQDPLDPEKAHKHQFAQPLVFFRLNPIDTLACSPYLRSLTNMRLRIPSRQVAPFIYNSPRSMPELRVLDLSTCSIRLTDVEALLARFRRLTHLRIDGCSIMKGDAQESEWANVGKTCALATAKAARDREKKLKVWLEVHVVRSSLEAELPNGSEEQVVAGRRARPGRRGLATATISFREQPTRTATPVIRASPTVVPKIRIVPTLPTLRSLSTTTNALYKDKHDIIRAQFEKGWDEGVAQLGAICSRLYQSWRNGVRMMHIAGDQGMEEGFEGLEDIDGEGAFHGRDVNVPVLCLAGGSASNSIEHVDGCGHTIAGIVWPDDI